MRDLPLGAGDVQAAGPTAGAFQGARRLGRTVQSTAFLLAYVTYLGAVVGLGQRLLLWPMIALFPRRRQSLVRGWLRVHARATLAMARGLADVRVQVRGVSIARESCLVVMNHQSVLDIPIALALVPGPYPLIPTRDRYRRGIPGISPLIRKAGYPFVAQGRAVTREELRALVGAAEAVADGSRSMVIYPEGHRTRDGRIGPFMRTGLRLVLRRARRPVYCVVADGITRSRTVADALRHFAGTRVAVTVLGPFDPPAAADVDRYIDELHARMTATLAAMRGEPVPDAPPAGLPPAEDLADGVAAG